MSQSYVVDIPKPVIREAMLPLVVKLNTAASWAMARIHQLLTFSDSCMENEIEGRRVTIQNVYECYLASLIVPVTA